MRQPAYSGQFKRDVRQAEKRGKNMGKLRAILTAPIEGKPLPVLYKDHPLKGEWAGFRDAHIEPGWVLIYKIDGEVVRFERTGRPVDLFEE